MTANAENGLAIIRKQWQNHQQVNPLHLLVLNLMPTKVTTEVQFLKRFNCLSRDVTLTFLYPVTHHFKGTSADLIRYHYFNLSQIKERHFDGLIVTGAPVEKLPFNQVDYWKELRSIISWANHHVRESLFECWAAQAGLFVDFNVPKRVLKSKLFGIFTATDINPLSRLARDFGAGGLIKMPQSRHSTSILDRRHLPGDLKIIADSKEAGPMILRSHGFHHTYITGHPEYDSDTLAKEYYRDQKKRRAIHAPLHYFTNEASGKINYSWQSASHSIYQNWLNTIAN